MIVTKEMYHLLLTEFLGQHVSVLKLPTMLHLRKSGIFFPLFLFLLCEVTLH